MSKTINDGGPAYPAPAPHAATHICDLCAIKADAIKYAEEIKGLREIIAQQSAAFHELEAERDRLAAEIKAEKDSIEKSCDNCLHVKSSSYENPCLECLAVKGWKNWTPRKVTP